MPIRVSTFSEEEAFQPDISSWLEEGDKLLKEGRFEEAEKCFLKVKEINPQSPAVYNGLGFVAYQKKDFKEAVKSFKKALQFNPAYSQAWNNLGASYLALSHFSEAKSAFAKAVGLNPNLQDALENLGWIVDNFFANSFKLPTLSVCLIMKNEEQNLPRLLSSVAEYGEEVVAVDTGSTDRSVEIARLHGAKVYFYRWNDDFSAAKNEALRHARGEWILALDADEEMNAEDLKKLKLILACSNYQAFMLPIKSPLDPEEKNHMLNYLVRVFKNRPEIRYRGRVHETVESSLLELGEKICKLHHLFISHHGYKEPGKTGWKVFSRNRDLLLKAAEEEPDNVNTLAYLGRTYLSQGHWEEAKEYLEKVLALSTGFNFSVLSARLDLAWIALQEDNLEEAFSQLTLLRQKEPHFPDGYYLLGLTYHKKGEYAEALAAFEQVFQVDYRKSGSPMFFFRVSLGDLYQKMGECYLLLGNPEKAKECLQKVEELSGDSASSLNNLGVAAMRLGEREKAENYFRKALTLDPAHPDARSNLFRFLLEAGRTKEAKRCLEEMKEFLQES
ncbi:MAG: hypothetical protein PWP04_362 [Candidatus Atribacteria bacterium]|nr:hypothetical protein [Candidatus Atribacteria bacterium]